MTMKLKQIRLVVFVKIASIQNMLELAKDNAFKATKLAWDTAVGFVSFIWLSLKIFTNWNLDQDPKRSFTVPSMVSFINYNFTKSSGHVMHLPEMFLPCLQCIYLKC